MAEQPYIEWYTSDFLNAVVDLPLEVTGAYTIILNLMADKGGPIEDDVQWLARRCNCSTRRMRQIRDALVTNGKLEERNGLLGNRKMLALVHKRASKSRQAAAAANARWERWRADNKPQLPLGDDNPQAERLATGEKDSRKTGEKVPKLPEKKSEINSANGSGESQNSANPAMRTHSDSRAGANPEPESIDRTIESQLEEEAGARASGLDTPADLVRLFERVSEVAGFVPRGARGYAEGIDQVRAWRDSGIDLEQTILPTIQRTLANAEPSDPTSSLKRFDRAVRTAHAHNSARASQPKQPAKPPPEPILIFKGEPDPIKALRQDILQRLGPYAYATFCHRARFVPEKQPSGKLVLFAIIDPTFPLQLLDGERITLIPAIARKHGFDEVWERKQLRLDKNDSGHMTKQ